MLSDSAYEQIKNRRDIGVVHLGPFRLKNVGRRSSSTREAAWLCDFSAFAVGRSDDRL
jgi:hypothetical protein